MRRPPTRRRLPWAMLAAALYAASAVVVPVVHARTEVWRSTSEVEAQHTPQCPRLHAEVSCLACGTFQFPTPLPRVLADTGPDRGDPTGRVGERVTLTREGPSQHSVRAPPAR